MTYAGRVSTRSFSLLILMMLWRSVSIASLIFSSLSLLMLEVALASRLLLWGVPVATPVFCCLPLLLMLDVCAAAFLVLREMPVATFSCLSLLQLVLVLLTLVFLPLRRVPVAPFSFSTWEIILNRQTISHFFLGEQSPNF
jgi:hypothetical protein